MSGYNWQIVAELRFVFTTVECLPQNLPVFYNHTLLGNPENRSVKTMKMITCWTFQHFTTMWQWLQVDIDSSVDCSFVYVADCLLPALLVRYFWPDNHPVWLRMRGDIYCFMSEIIFNISNSMWSAKPLGVFFFSAFLIFRFREALSLPPLLPVCYSCPHRCRLFVYGISLWLCHSTKRCK